MTIANALAIFPRSHAAVAQCERALRQSFPIVRSTPEGWLVGERPLVRSRVEASERSLVVWEGAVPVDARVDATSVVSRLRHAQGDFGFAVLESGGDFVAVRSAGGLVPVYVCQDADATWLATSFEDLVRTRLAAPPPDRLVQALWAEGNSVFPDGRTFVEGVRILPRGHYWVGRGSDLSTRPYWDPRPEALSLPSESMMQAHADELREALVEGLRTLDTEGQNLLTLSGGVDSSCLAHLAASLGYSIATLTFVAPAGSTAEGLQLSYVDELTRELRIEHAFKLQAEDAFLDELFNRPLPALFFCPHPALRFLPELMQTLTPRVLFNGHFADEVCGHSQRLQDWMRHTSLRCLFDPKYPRPSGSRDIARWFKRRALEGLGHPLLPIPREIGRHFSPALRDEVAEWSERERRTLISDRRPLRELSAWCRLDGWIAMHWECCTRWGVRPLQPFFTRRVLELAYRCHPVELFGPGTKKLLRRALQGRVPTRYLERPDKGQWPPRRALSPRAPEVGLPDDLLDFLAPECRRPGVPLTGLQHRQFSQIVLFARKIRELRHEGSARIVSHEHTAAAKETVH